MAASRLLLAAVALGCVTVVAAQPLTPYRPTSDQLAESYRRADAVGRLYNGAVTKTRLAPTWAPDGSRFWYRNDLQGGVREFVLVESANGRKQPAFDHARLAAALSTQLGRQIAADRLPIEDLTFVEDGRSIRFTVQNRAYIAVLQTMEIREAGAETPRPQRPTPPWTQNLWAPERRDAPSPDGKWVARIDGHNVKVRQRDGAEFTLTDFGTDKAYFTRLGWTPDSKRIVAVRLTPGERGLVHLVESSPQGGGRARLHTRVYDLPGDKVDVFDMWLLDPEGQTSAEIEAEPVDYWGMPTPRWNRARTHFTYEKLDRGYGRWRIIQVDPATNTSRALWDDDPETFFDITSKYSYYCNETDEILVRSERDGWAHLYRIDGNGVLQNQITKGPWVVRGVTHVDEKARQIIFSASGIDQGLDPYFIKFYRVNFDGTGLTPLTPAAGNHSVQFSPDYRFYVDTYSTVGTPPVHELRRTSDGRLISEIERADISRLPGTGWSAPEVFVAKGRDGVTDIWGVVVRPSHFDPTKSYPVIEDIYAGPHDSFVPKSFAAHSGMQSLAELGFVVVKIDGMGTRNRSKAFHDVAYKNLADNGFEDRILWMRALAERYPQLDLDRVGIFGTSAGGQSSTAALLFRPEFYKVAVSSCGCHDNRMDKIWWNEQWMGLMGPHYAEQSNITNAGKLKGNLLLMVGEMDTNVPPESTYRLVDALIKANKEFEFVLLPGAGHTGGGPYGERKRRDFFVRHLLGVPTPNWNN
jgi:dipeptidyl aminopeptidase/acylaminoacyl peptidase